MQNQQEKPDMFNELRFVLVETSHPGNIGASARALKTMGFSQLSLVSPKNFPSDEASARASGADDILDQAVVYPNLAAALADCHYVYATSARPRSLGWPMQAPREAVQDISQRVQTGKVAVVFGRERTGLSNEELDLCQSAIQIPTAQSYASLNLAAAVQIIAYELRVQTGLSMPHVSSEDDEPATRVELERLMSSLETSLIAVDYLDPNNPRLLMRRLRRMINRADLSHSELQIMLGICKSMRIAGEGHKLG